MRKLLALALILGLASMANAAIELSVNGAVAPPEITLEPSDWIELDILVSQELGGGDMAIILSNAQGHLKYDEVLFDLSGPMGRGGTWYTGPWDGPWVVQPSSTPQQVNINGGNAAMNRQPDFVLMWNLWFHCDETTPVTIDLVAISDIIHYEQVGPDVLPITDIPAGTTIYSIHVIQPEPMTLSLLGLGGLALLRRRR